MKISRKNLNLLISQVLNEGNGGGAPDLFAPQGQQNSQAQIDAMYRELESLNPSKNKTDNDRYSNLANQILKAEYKSPASSAPADEALGVALQVGDFPSISNFDTDAPKFLSRTETFNIVGKMYGATTGNEGIPGANEYFTYIGSTHTILFPRNYSRAKAIEFTDLYYGSKLRHHQPVDGDVVKLANGQYLAALWAY